MDFDYTTILYVILGIIYFIFTGISKNKKKAQQEARKTGAPSTETVGPPPVSRRPTFEELLQEFTGQEPIAPEPVIVVQEVVAPIKIAEPVKKQPVRASIKEARKEISPLFGFQAYDIDEEEREDYAEVLSDLDGAKRAFIASEIFQRKY